MSGDLTEEKVTEALQDIITTLKLPENVKKLEEAWESIGIETFKVFEKIFPIVVELQAEVLKKHGLISSSQELVSCFAVIKGMEKENTEIARLMTTINDYWRIKINTNSAVNITPDNERSGC